MILPHADVSLICQVPQSTEEAQTRLPLLQWYTASCQLRCTVQTVERRSTSLLLLTDQMQHSKQEPVLHDLYSTAVARLSGQQFFGYALAGCMCCTKWLQLLQQLNWLSVWFRSLCCKTSCGHISPASSLRVGYRCSLFLIEAQAATEGLRIGKDGCTSVLRDLDLGTTSPQESALSACAHDTAGLLRRQP